MMKEVAPLKLACPAQPYRDKDIPKMTCDRRRFRGQFEECSSCGSVTETFEDYVRRAASIGQGDTIKLMEPELEFYATLYTSCLKEAA